MAASPTPWWAIVGPTGVGKSEVADYIAAQLQTDIIMADSRQVYQGMDIGTGKAQPDSINRIFRHLVDLVPPYRRFSAGAYKEVAEEVITGMEKANKTVLIEGGTGLYLRAVLYGFWEGPSADWSLRKKLSEKGKKDGEESLHRLLQKIDPIASENIHVRDLQKIIRALEVYQLTGRRISDIHAGHRAKRPKPHPCRLFGLFRDRKSLYKRIEMRVDQMISAGLVDEVKGLLDQGLSPDLPAMRGLGYRQIVPYLKGKRTLEASISILKRDTRRFAKRQLCWFRAEPLIKWIEVKEGEAAEDTATRIMRLKKCDIML
ncbi:MAG: tRNA (adenosine(37)-N6)-dimethylallyltransferase MiaA [Nitrospiria bacterium]